MKVEVNEVTETMQRSSIFGSGKPRDEKEYEVKRDKERKSSESSDATAETAETPRSPT